MADAGDAATWKSLRNVRGVHLLASGQLNVYDVLVSDHVVFTESALAAFVGRTGAGPAADAETAVAQDAGTEPAAAEETPTDLPEPLQTEPEDDES